MRLYVHKYLIFLRLMVQLSIITRKYFKVGFYLGMFISHEKRTHNSTHESILKIDPHSLDKFCFLYKKHNHKLYKVAITKPYNN